MDEPGTKDSAFVDDLIAGLQPVRPVRLWAVYAAALAGSGAALLPHGLAGPGLIVPMLVPVVGWVIWKAIRRQPIK